MADILIKNVKIWERCADCPMAGWDRTDHCLITGRDIFPYAVDGKPYDCPLVELPEHGDLIDRSKLSFVCGGTAPMGMDYVRRYVVDGMPVVIPSNKEDAE